MHIICRFPFLCYTYHDDHDIGPTFPPHPHLANTHTSKQREALGPQIRRKSSFLWGIIEKEKRMTRITAAKTRKNAQKLRSEVEKERKCTVMNERI
jgi:hypothetical protein